MDLKLTNRIAVVAGGSRGSGYAVAAELAAEGARVVLTGRNPVFVADAVDRITQAGGTVRGLVTNMVSVEDAKRIVDLAREAFDFVVVLVCNEWRLYIAQTGACHARFQIGKTFLGNIPRI